MKKRISKKTKPAKRNQTDITLRNLRAMKKRIVDLEVSTAASMRMVHKLIRILDDRLTKLTIASHFYGVDND